MSGCLLHFALGAQHCPSTLGGQLTDGTYYRPGVLPDRRIRVTDPFAS